MKSIVSSILVLLIVPTLFLFSDTDSNEQGVHGRSLEEVLGNIRSEQGIGAKETINSDKVSDILFEELGEAYMSLMIPDPKQHGWMDKMMGGEGSDSLAAMHKWMGYRYLTEDRSFMIGQMSGGMIQGMNGFGGMNFGMGGNWSMWSPWTVIPWILSGILTIVVVILSFILLRRNKV